MGGSRLKTLQSGPAMDVISLTADNYRLVFGRHAENDNSHRRMSSALAESGSTRSLERLRALRSMEVHFGVDLGSLCFRFTHRNDKGTHPIEQTVLAYMAQWRSSSAGADE